MKNILIAAISFLSFFSSAQFDIKWSEISKNNNFILKLLPISSSTAEFYTIQRNKKSECFLAHHTNFIVDLKKMISVEIENKKGIIEAIEIVNNLPVVFISTQDQGEYKLYYQKYSELCDAIGKPKEILTYKTPNNWKNERVFYNSDLEEKGTFKIHFSQDKNFFCLNYQIPLSDEINHKFGFLIFNKNFELISEKILPYNSNSASITNNYLTDKGELIFVIKEYENELKKDELRTTKDLFESNLVKYSSNDMTEFKLKLSDERIISNLSFIIDSKNKMVIVGLYYKEFIDSIEGVFNFTINMDSKIRTKLNYNDFETIIPHLKVRDFHILADGSFISLFEQFHQISYYAGSINSGIYNHLYYENVFVCKIDKNGISEWMKTIEKIQISMHSREIYCSFKSFYFDEKLHVIFNDNSRNYNKEGGFIENLKQITTASMYGPGSCQSHVLVDISEGEIERKMFFQNEKKNYFNPMCFSLFPDNNNKNLLFLPGKKTKFGIISFE